MGEIKKTPKKSLMFPQGFGVTLASFNLEDKLQNTLDDMV
jgi:hypothetical protein